jgi:hypothetical protein
MKKQPLLPVQTPQQGESTASMDWGTIVRHSLFLGRIRSNNGRISGYRRSYRKK